MSTVNKFQEDRLGIMGVDSNGKSMGRHSIPCFRLPANLFGQKFADGSFESDLPNDEWAVRVVLDCQKEPGRWAKIGVVKDRNDIVFSLTGPTIKSKPECKDKTSYTGNVNHFFQHKNPSFRHILPRAEEGGKPKPRTGWDRVEVMKK